MRPLLLALLLATAPLTLAARPPVAVERATIPWLPGWLPHPGYFHITNTGERAVQLTGARSHEFARIEFHAADDGDMIALEKAALPIEIRPGESRTFGPGGPRLMLFVQNKWLEPGEQAEIELTFQGFDPVPVTFTVRKESPY